MSKERTNIGAKYSMSVAGVVKQIRALPYADMMMVANEVKDRIKDLTSQKIEAVVLADILSRIQPGDIPVSDATKEEEKILNEVFRRKVSLSIQRLDKGWEIGVSVLPGSNVVGTELRPMFGQLLDQVITMHVLSK